MPLKRNVNVVLTTHVRAFAVRSHPLLYHPRMFIILRHGIPRQPGGGPVVQYTAKVCGEQSEDAKNLRFAFNQARRSR